LGGGEEAKLYLRMGERVDNYPPQQYMGMTYHYETDLINTNSVKNIVLRIGSDFYMVQTKSNSPSPFGYLPLPQR
jgi:hypothetical protein